MHSANRSAAIEEANNKTVEILLQSRPQWVDVLPAGDVLPGMTKETILHAGPPIEWEGMAAAQRNGIINGVLYEELARDREEALRLVESGAVRIAPCHGYAAVGGMAGITTASMPVVVVRNEPYGALGYSQLFQGPGVQEWRWEDYGQAAIAQWRWLRDVLGPTLKAGIRAMGQLDVKNVIARALQMGDECHNRNVAGTVLLLRELVPHLLRAGVDGPLLGDSITYLTKADQFFLTLSMAAAKAMSLAASNVPHSTIVTTMARNGVEFGIKVSGLGDRWFTAPANPVDGLYFSSEWGPEDATLDLGDSAIMEVVGLGGIVQAAAPALQLFVGGSFRRALELTKEMGEICAGVNTDFLLPNLDFAGAPLGIDLRKVVKTGITPIIDTAIGHKDGGVIGAGQVRAPIDCFNKALMAYAEKYLSLSDN